MSVETDEQRALRLAAEKLAAAPKPPVRIMHYNVNGTTGSLSEPI